MGVVYCKPAKRGTGVTVKNGRPGIKTDLEDSWIVRCDSTSTDRMEIVFYPGVAIADPHPSNTACVCDELSAKPIGNSGLLWLVTAKYTPFDPKDQQPGSGLDLPVDQWTAGGSAKSVPVFMDAFPAPKIITNSAGDPLEGLMKEECEYTLNLTTSFATHEGWMDVAASHVDHCNDAVWHGGAIETWLCRFRNAQLEVKVTEEGSLVYWSTQWEFAYNKTTWRLMPWNVGFHELPDGGWSPGAGAPGGATRQTILGADGKSVKNPVALNADGTAKPAGQPPDVVEGQDGNPGVRVYPLADFSVFGNIFTPTL